jgi:hypothetical protein
LPPDEPLQLPVFSVKTVQSIEIMRQKSYLDRLKFPHYRLFLTTKKKKERKKRVECSAVSMAVVVTAQWKSPCPPYNSIALDNT